MFSDETWAFVQKKEGNMAPFEAHNYNIGDAYYNFCHIHKTPRARTEVFGSTKEEPLWKNAAWISKGRSKQMTRSS